MKMKLKKSIVIFLLFQIGFSISLWDVYFESEPAHGYDKYMILNPNEEYIGGFGVYEGLVFIEGNGAVIDLQDGLGIWVSGSDSISEVRLDMEYLTIINGSEYGAYYSGYANGSIKNCNFINDFMGLKMLDQTFLNVVNCNFIDNEEYGFAIYSSIPTHHLSYCNGWNNGETYMENCPG